MFQCSSLLWTSLQLFSMCNYIRKTEEAKILDAKAGRRWREGCKHSEQTSFAMGGNSSTGSPRDAAHQLCSQHAEFLLTALWSFRPSATFCAIVVWIEFAAKMYPCMAFGPCLTWWDLRQIYFEEYQNNQVWGHVQFVEARLYWTGHLIASGF